MDSCCKRKRSVEVDLSEFSPEELECAETLLSLSSCSSTLTNYCSSSSSSNSQTQPTPTNKPPQPRRLVIRPPKPPSLPSLDSILAKFEPHDPSYGTKYLIVDKPLTPTDAKDSQGRLGIPNAGLSDEVRATFLTQQERDELDTIYGIKSGKIPVKVRGCFSDKVYDLTLCKWYYQSQKGFKYALNGKWTDFRTENGLHSHDHITVAAVRSRGVLCLAVHGGRRPDPQVVQSRSAAKKSKRSAPAAAPIPWQRTLPRGAKGADWKHVHTHDLIRC